LVTISPTLSVSSSDCEALSKQTIHECAEYVEGVRLAGGAVVLLAAAPLVFVFVVVVVVVVVALVLVLVVGTGAVVIDEFASDGVALFIVNDPTNIDMPLFPKYSLCFSRKC
jgi:hypothetical protein